MGTQKKKTFCRPTDRVGSVYRAVSIAACYVFGVLRSYDYLRKSKIDRKKGGVHSSLCMGGVRKEEGRRGSCTDIKEGK